MALTEAQIATLRTAYEHALQEGSASAAADYYRELGKHFAYGRLALGVQENNTLPGIIANNYATNKLAGDLALGYGPAQEDAVRRALLAADFNTRAGIGWSDLGGEEISRYHDAAFLDVYSGNPRAPEAWTAFHIVRALGDYSSWISESWASSANLYFRMTGLQNNPLAASSAGYGHAYEWSQDMNIGLVIDWRTKTSKPGDGVLADSLLTYGAATGLTFVLQKVFRISLEGAGGGNPFWSGAAEALLMDAVLRNPDDIENKIDGFTTFGPGTATFQVINANAVAADGDAWLKTMLTGAKLSLVGEFNEANWRSVESPGQGLGSLFQRIDSFSFDRVVLQQTGITIAGGDDVSALLGGRFSGTFIAGRGDTAIFAGAGSDRVVDGAGDDLLTGGDGHDHLSSSAGRDWIDGGRGNDVIDARGFVSSSASATVVMREGGGHDVIKTTGRQLGSNWAEYEEHSGVEVIDFADVASTDVSLFWDWHAEDEYHFMDYIHTETGFGEAAIVLNSTGDSIHVGRVNGGFSIVGGVREDTATSASGIQLRFSDRTVDGSDWGDLFRFDRGAVIGALPSQFTSAENDFMRDWALEPGSKLPTGSRSADLLSGGFHSDTISGLDGNDTLFGFEGNDVLNGNLGDDVMLGGEGSDTLNGTGGNDVLNGG